MKKILVFLVLVVALAGGLFFAWKKNYFEGVFPSTQKESSNKPESKQNSDKKVESAPPTTRKEFKNSFEDLNGAKPIYYYGAECPHCKEVLSYLDKNNIYSKVDFIKKEVWNDKNNGMELSEAARKCGMNPSSIGVPFVFDNGKCYMGGPDVKSFFAEKAGIKAE